jgi:hypothetical protein
MQIGHYSYSGENLKNRIPSIAIGTLASLLMIMLMAMIAAPVNAGTPSQPHNANAMWVEPGTITLNTSSIGTTFNATVSLNLTDSIYGYQVALRYNRTLLKCSRAGFTDGITSNYCSGHTTIQGGPTIDTSGLGNGSVQAGESLLGNDFVPGPNNGTLVWIEFQVLNFTAFIPPSGSIITTLDIGTEYPSNTYALAQDGITNVDFAASNATITITPEFPYLAILPIFMALTLAGAVLSRRQKKLK